MKLNKAEAILLDTRTRVTLKRANAYLGPADVEEVVHDVVGDLTMRFERRSQDPESFERLLGASVKPEITKALKKLRRNQKRCSSCSSLDNVPRDGNSPQCELEQTELLQVVEDSLSTIPYENRIAIQKYLSGDQCSPRDYRLKDDGIRILQRLFSKRGLL